MMFVLSRTSEGFDQICDVFVGFVSSGKALHINLDCLYLIRKGFIKLVT